MFDTYEEIFAERAASYQAAMAQWPDARRAEFEALIAPLGDLAGMLLCDMPAGGGYLRRHLPPEAHYLAVEPTAYFHSVCPRDSRSSAVRGPLDKVPLPDGGVDHVVSLAGLHHAPNLPAVFAEMRRLLSIGGRASICDVDVGCTSAKFLNGFVDRHNPMGHDGVFLDATTATTLSVAGFAVVADEIVVTPWTFSDDLQAGAFCARLFGVDGLTDADVARVLDEEIGFMPASDGIALQWTLRRIVAIAR